MQARLTNERLIQTRIPKAPTSFDGTLEELYDECVQRVLPSVSDVEEFHTKFCEYLDSEDPLFLVRQVAGLERGTTVRTRRRSQLRATDNAPAWWIHYKLFSQTFRQIGSFAEFVESIPCHMFKVNLPDNISSAGWHVAHIFNAKDGNIDFFRWDRRELIRRAVRNIHPCNYFYIPKTEWQRYGGTPSVISFFHDKFKARYHSIWAEFANFAQGRLEHMVMDAGRTKYIFSIDEPILPVTQATLDDGDGSRSNLIIKYSHSRLCFKADVIEPLKMEDRFCIETKQGTFTMSKREFYETFPNVVQSHSYTRDRQYHFPKVPEKAERFRTK